MIDFTKDNPHGPKPATAVTSRLRIIGLGHTGAGALDQVVLYGHDTYDMCLIDTDQQELQGSVVPQKLQIGQEVTRGMGCNGDMELGAHVAGVSEMILEKAVQGYDYVLLVVGLGGATGPSLAPLITKLAQEDDAKVIVMACMPCEFEGRRRLCQALDALTELRGIADAVMVFNNDRVARIPAAATNIRHGFHLLNKLMGRTVEALAQMLGKRGLIQLTFADLRSLFGRYQGTEIVENAWVGWGEVGPDDDAVTLVDQVMESPLFDDETVWQEADHAVVCLTGGRELGLVEVQNVLAELQERIPSDIPLSACANLDERGDGQLRLTLMLADTTPPVVKLIPADEAEPIVEEDDEPITLQPVKMEAPMEMPVSSRRRTEPVRMATGKVPASKKSPAKAVSIQPPSEKLPAAALLVEAEAYGRELFADESTHATASLALVANDTGMATPTLTCDAGDEESKSAAFQPELLPASANGGADDDEDSQPHFYMTVEDLLSEDCAPMEAGDGAVLLHPLIPSPLADGNETSSSRIPRTAGLGMPPRKQSTPAPATLIEEPAATVEEDSTMMWEDTLEEPIAEEPAAVEAVQEELPMPEPVVVVEPVAHIAPEPAPVLENVKPEEVDLARGRFEKSVATVHEGENLDQPAFRRRKLRVRL